MNKQASVTKIRAIYTGLYPFLKRSELLKVLAHWQDNYSRAPTFSIRYFLSDIESVVGREVEIKKMLINVAATLNKPEKELLPDPSEALSKYKKNIAISSPKHNYKIPEVEAFELLVKKWLGFVSDRDREYIASFVSLNLPDEDISITLKTAVKRWLRYPNEKIGIAYVETEDLRLLINLFYQGFCEELGPVASDELLAKAVITLKNNGGAAYSELFSKLL